MFLTFLCNACSVTYYTFVLTKNVFFRIWEHKTLVKLFTVLVLVIFLLNKSSGPHQPVSLVLDYIIVQN